MLTTIRDSMKRGEKVVLTGFGTFSIRTRQQRVGRNPKTGAKITLAARKAPGWIVYLNWQKEAKRYSCINT